MIFIKRNVNDLKGNQALIEFRGVSKNYANGTHALNDVNIKINKGEFVFVVGASGAGKSTFIKLMMHEEKCNTGEVIVNGYKMSKIKRREVPYFRRTMGIVFQDFRLIPNMTVFGNVAFSLRVVGASTKDIRRRVASALSMVGLGNKARCYPNELSGGEQQRVGLARALVNNPQIIIADEPTGGTHFSLVIAGAYGKSFQEAEAFKRDESNHEELTPVIRPVVDKVSSIISSHIKGHRVDEISLVGGTCCFTGIEEMIEKKTGIHAHKPHNPMFVTPLGIALSCRQGEM